MEAQPGSSQAINLSKSLPNPVLRTTGTTQSNVIVVPTPPIVSLRPSSVSSYPVSDSQFVVKGASDVVMVDGNSGGGGGWPSGHRFGSSSPALSLAVSTTSTTMLLPGTTLKPVSLTTKSSGLVSSAISVSKPGCSPSSQIHVVTGSSSAFSGGKWSENSLTTSPFASGVTTLTPVPSQISVPPPSGSSLSIQTTANSQRKAVVLLDSTSSASGNGAGSVIRASKLASPTTISLASSLSLSQPPPPVARIVPQVTSADESSSSSSSVVTLRAVATAGSATLTPIITSTVASSCSAFPAVATATTSAPSVTPVLLPVPTILRSRRPDEITISSSSPSVRIGTHITMTPVTKSPPSSLTPTTEQPKSPSNKLSSICLSSVIEQQLSSENGTIQAVKRQYESNQNPPTPSISPRKKPRKQCLTLTMQQDVTTEPESSAPPQPEETATESPPPPPELVRPHMLDPGTFRMNTAMADDIDGGLVYVNAKRNHFVQRQQQSSVPVSQPVVGHKLAASSSGGRDAGLSKRDLKHSSSTAALCDMANQRYIMQRINGWKLHHVAAQMLSVANGERDSLDELVRLQKCVNRFARETSGEPSGSAKRPAGQHHRLIYLIQESLKANLQRVKLIEEQLVSAKVRSLALTNVHKERMGQILRRFASRRPVRSTPNSSTLSASSGGASMGATAAAIHASRFRQASHNDSSIQRRMK